MQLQSNIKNLTSKGIKIGCHEHLDMNLKRLANKKGMISGIYKLLLTSTANTNLQTQKRWEQDLSITLTPVEWDRTYVTQVTATDADDPTYGNSARIVYSILHGQPYFSVDPKTGVIRTALANMDREIKGEYQVLLQAKDMGGLLGGLASTTTINVTLGDVNDNPPRFAKSKTVSTMRLMGDCWMDERVFDCCD
ncbi:hypothetical protein F7725_012001 [Dissostichus mawsoni]|uniref:Cadherin domain-containing protein n=1 Tax=Dissostichus mawsoni TaxID=36200 RepID=A0A7J5ZB56_DISMA|nr:hypothetical protein F7725_012001 [Dissostichus mawsoni]